MLQTLRARLSCSDVPVHLDALHVVARVAWSAVCACDGRPEVSNDFEAHELQEREGVLRTLGWVSGDEEALMRAHGVLD